MRRFGIAALGVVGGLLLAIVVQDLLTRSLTQENGLPKPAAIVVGSLLPVFGLLGAASALWLDRRRPRREASRGHQD